MKCCVFSFFKIVLVLVSNHRIIETCISCSLFLGPVVGGYLSDTLGFEWAAAVISFTGLFAVSLLACRPAAIVWSTTTVLINILKHHCIALHCWISGSRSPMLWLKMPNKW